MTRQDILFIICTFIVVGVAYYFVGLPLYHECRAHGFTSLYCLMK